jgi:hypothetical protein
MLEEVKKQSTHNKCVLAVAELTLTAAIFMPIIVDEYLKD